MIYKNVKLSEIFTIKKTTGINTNKLSKTESRKIAYVTRTSLNNGIHSYTNKIEGINPNPKKTISIGLLDMTEFYQKTEWYSGQFVRLIEPKFEINEKIALFFLSYFKKLRPIWKSVLVRDFDKAFNETIVSLPFNEKNEIDFKYIEQYIKEVEKQYIKEVDTYLSVLGYKDINDCKLTKEDEYLLNNDPITKEFRLEELFEITGTKSIDEKNIQYTNEKSAIDFVTRTKNIPGKINKLDYEPNEPYTISATVIGNKKYVKYHKKPYYCCQNINKLIPKFKINENIALYFISFISKFVKLYDGQQSGYKMDDIRKHKINLPYNFASNEIDYAYMQKYIKVIKKIKVLKLREKIDNELELLKSIQ